MERKRANPTKICENTEEGVCEKKPGEGVCSGSGQYVVICFLYPLVPRYQCQVIISISLCCSIRTFVGFQSDIRAW